MPPPPEKERSAIPTYLYTAEKYFNGYNSIPDNAVQVFWIQHASIMLKSPVPHFYPKVHLEAFWNLFQKFV